MSEPIYPRTPTDVDPQSTKPSAEFRKQVTRVMGSIIFFVVVYFALLIGALALAVLCGLGGIGLISAFPGLATILIGIGMVGLGVIVIVFLVKFIFSSKEVDRSHLTPITRKDQPELFAFIKQLTTEVGAPFPKKIFLSPEVNAYVFYNSSFWSMFLPVRKNLVIGLGMVNGINVSELKAILAHEFGHFSQRSMALGSYVYNVNRIIFDMLYDNKGLGESLEAWGNMSSYFAFFSMLTEAIINGIQSILKSVYAIVNKNHMSLSRQMEFHADAVAASVSGSASLITALRRLEFADGHYRELMNRYNGWIRRGLKPDNIFPQHLELMAVSGRKHNLNFAGGLPVVSAAFFRSLKTSRLLIEDQWASHPSTEDREASLNKLGVVAEVSELPAWAAFQNAEELQRRITDFMFEEVTFASPPQLVGLDQFAHEYQEELVKFDLGASYKGFYDHRNLPQGEEIDAPANQNLDSILSDEVLRLPARLVGIESDMDLLERLQSPLSKIKTFEFAGQKYDRRDAKELLKNLKTEKDGIEQQLKTADNRLFTYFLSRARKNNAEEELKSRQRAFQETQKEAEGDVDIYNNVIRIISPIYQGNVTYEKAHAVNNQTRIHERAIKESLTRLIADPAIDHFLDAEKRKKIEAYAAKERHYFTSSGFDGQALGLLTDALSIFYGLVTEKLLHSKKDLLSWQASL